MQLLRDKADIELLQINGDRIGVVVYVSEPDMPPHIIGSYAYLWMMVNDITGQNGLFVDKIDITEYNFEDNMCIVVGHSTCAEQNSHEPIGANPT